MPNPIVGGANPAVTLPNPAAGGAPPTVTFPPPTIGFAPPTVAFPPLLAKTGDFPLKTAFPRRTGARPLPRTSPAGLRPQAQGGRDRAYLGFAFGTGSNPNRDLGKIPVAALYERRGNEIHLENDGGRRPPLQPRMTFAEISNGVVAGIIRQAATARPQPRCGWDGGRTLTHRSLADAASLGFGPESPWDSPTPPWPGRAPRPCPP